MCRITHNYYSKTIEFQDINYQLAQNEDKEAIFENWCEFLNYFDSSIHFQFTFFNTAAGRRDIQFLCYRSSRNLNRLSISFVVM